MPVLGATWCVAAHPRKPCAVCFDEGGALYVLDLVGIADGGLEAGAPRSGGIEETARNGWTSPPDVRHEP